MKRSTLKTTRLLYSFILMILLAVQANVVHAETKKTQSVSTLSTTLQITASGDSNMKVEYQVPQDRYQSIKKNMGSAVKFAQAISNNFGWSLIRNVSGSFNDAQFKINASMTQIGYSKPYREGRWSVNLSKDSMNFVSLKNGVARFKTSSKNSLGLLNSNINIVLPQGSIGHQYNTFTKVLSYQFVPKTKSNKPGEVEFSLEAKSKLMSSLAKVYGDEKFTKFWVARSKFQNVGGQVIRNLRIRHRIENLSSWSRWNKSKVVYPNQTVIEAFFPVFDIEKLAQFTEARTAMVRVEYTYTMGGKTYTDTDSRKIKILSRNEILWSSRPSSEAKTWHDLFDNSKMIAAVFCSSNDPVMQQVAGVVTRMGGGQSQSTDKGAEHFLRMMWKFMEINKISYQSPVGSRLEGYLSQHIKYGRDVISNRGGTCIDLSVLWVSVARAVGLKASVVIVPGHAFPVIHLPSGKTVAIESTLILHGSFDEAVKRGNFRLNVALGKIKKDAKGNPIKYAGMILIADVSKMRERGIHSLDLPRVADGYLLKLNYRLEVPKVVVKNTTKSNITRTNYQVTNNKNTNTNNKNTNTTVQNTRTLQNTRTVQNNRLPKNLHGTWVCVQDNVRVGIYMGPNGKYGCMMQTYDNYGQLDSQESAEGSWSVNGKNFYISTNRGNKTGRYYFQDNRLVIIIDGDTCVFVKR